MMIMMTMVMISNILPQSFLLGASVLKPHLDHTHVKPGLCAQSLAHLSRRLSAGVIGPFQRVQLLAADRCPWSLADTTDDPTVVVSVRTGTVCNV